MKTITCEIDNEAAQLLAEVAATRGTDEQKLVAEILNTFIRREKLRRKREAGQPAHVDPEEHEEDLQLAEWGMADYAERLAEEDQA